MFTKVLVASDGSPLSEQAVEAALVLAQELGARLVALSVADPYPYSPMAESGFADEREQFEALTRELAAERVARIASAAKARGLACATVAALSDSPWEEIIKTAEAHECDLIVMASHGRKGLSRLLLGSETQKVLAHSKIPVLVHRQG